MILPATREATARVAADLYTRLDGIIEEQFGRQGEPTSVIHLRWMMHEVMHEASRWPIDKANRWIGYVQGVMAARGLLNVDDERGRTRLIFQTAYEADGIEKP